jgi:gas vesicle protein
MVHDDQDSFTRASAAFLIGGALGAIAALLLAPKSGQEMRDDLRRGYERSRAKWTETEGEVADRIARLAEDLQKKAEELVTSGKTLVEERRKDLQEAIAIAKRALDEERALLRRLRTRAASSEDGEQARPNA